MTRGEGRGDEPEASDAPGGREARDPEAHERALSRFDRLLAEEHGAGAQDFFERLWMESLPGGLPIVVIGQIQRCGGTLLSRLLDGHPEIRAYPLELYWGAPSEYDWPRQALLELAPAEAFRELAAGNVHQIRRFTTTGYRKSKRDDPADGQTFAFSLALQRRDFLARLEAAPADRRSLLDAFMASFFTAWLDYQSRYGSPRMLTAFGKRHNFSPAVDELFADYPDGRLLSLVREPTSWYASAANHQPDRYEDVERAIELWTSSALASRRAHERWPDQVTLLSFDRLVGDTAAVMQELAGVLGVSWSDALAVPTVNGRPTLSNSSFAPAQTVDATALRRGEALDRAVAEHIRRETRALYEECLALAL